MLSLKELLKRVQNTEWGNSKNISGRTVQNRSTACRFTIFFEDKRLNLNKKADDGQFEPVDLLKKALILRGLSDADFFVLKEGHFRDL